MECVKKLLSVDFEVFGKVQGVWFRKYTQSQGKSLQLVGWCMNTPKGTVVGVMQGELTNIEQMKKWLETKGSPLSRIDHADFSNEKSIDTLAYNEFSIRR